MTPSSHNDLPGPHPVPPRKPSRQKEPFALPSSRPLDARPRRRVHEAGKISQDAFVNGRKLHEDEDELFLSDDVEGISIKQRVSSWALSLAVHGVILLVLAFIFFPPLSQPVDLQAIFSETLGDQLDFLTEDSGNLNPNEAEEYELTIPDEVRIDDLIVFEEQDLPFDPRSNAPAFEQMRIDMSDMLTGRTDPGVKNDLLAKYGGTKLTEDAVDAGLQWLRRQQNSEGWWSLYGPYSNGINPRTTASSGGNPLSSDLANRPAATALALLAFQGAGNTRSSGQYASVVRRGWVWLLRQQDSDGNFAPKERVNEALFYTQALCTLALCELIALEKKSNPELRRAARKALDYLLENQNEQLGGWRYESQVGSDLSVTGWCLMALRTSEMAGFTRPKASYDKISAFLDSVSYDNGAGYVYQLVGRDGKISETEMRPSMTATGLFCRQFLGWPQNSEALLRGAETLVSEENLIRFPTTEEEKEKFSCNTYGWYATSMALKGLGPYNKYWRKWNAALNTELPRNQEPKGSKEAGSWDPRYDEYNFGGGRLYVTCLSILCLEVYYRHLPLYQ